MQYRNDARFPLSEHIFRPHYSAGVAFSETENAGYTPEMLRRAYSFDGENTGRGMKIAIIAAFDNEGIVQNMNVFCERFGLPKPKISLYYPDGKGTGTSRNWIVESSLDTQWVHVFAPDAEILVVFSYDASVKALLSAARYAFSELYADVVSMSFGTEESAKDKGLADFMSEGGIFVSSSGDVGGRVSFPSSSPHCISVGGTDLVLGSFSRRLLETAWHDGGAGASDVFDILPYQARFFNIYAMSQGKRSTPDLALSASFSPGAAVYVSELGGWTTVGGTSLSTACFAGVCACIKGKNPQISTSLDMLSYLYGKAGTTGYAIPQYSFNDITLGRSGDFYAQRGWDFCTGLGSPVIIRLTY